MSLLERLSELFWDSLAPLKAITIPLYTLAGVGIYLRSFHDGTDIHLLYHTLPWYAWSLLTAYCTIARVIGITCWRGTRFTRLITPILGITIWSFLLAASIKSPDDFGMGLLYIVALMLEFWVLVRVFFARKNKTA